MREALTPTVTCEECHRPWLDDARAWQAHRVDLEEVAFYCPECAEREFEDD